MTLTSLRAAITLVGLGLMGMSSTAEYVCRLGHIIVRAETFILPFSHAVLKYKKNLKSQHGRFRVTGAIGCVSANSILRV